MEEKTLDERKRKLERQIAMAKHGLWKKADELEDLPVKTKNWIQDKVSATHIAKLLNWVL